LTPASFAAPQLREKKQNKTVDERFLVASAGDFVQAMEILPRFLRKTFTLYPQCIGSLLNILPDCQVFSGPPVLVYIAEFDEDFTVSASSAFTING
jgi:hypothetical protein